MVENFVGEVSVRDGCPFAIDSGHTHRIAYMEGYK